jgi:hypothetical protein
LTIDLPEPIAAYIAAENAGDQAAAAQCFADAAVVRDDGQTHAGIAAITRWKAETTRAYQATMQPLAVAEREGKTVVTSQISGNFPGSPIDLQFVFGLANGKIASLEIS